MRITLNADLVHFPHINKIAQGLAIFEMSGQQVYPEFLGHCDNFLIYVKHYMYDDYFQILDIVTPDAHKNIDKFIAVLVEKAEAFYQLNREQLDKLPYYTVVS